MISKQNKLLLPIMGYGKKGFFNNYVKVSITGQLSPSTEYDLTCMFGGRSGQEMSNITLPSVPSSVKVKSLDLFMAQPLAPGDGGYDSKALDGIRNAIPAHFHNFVQGVNNNNTISCSYVGTFCFCYRYTRFTPNANKEYSDIRYMFTGSHFDAYNDFNLSKAFLDKVIDVSYLFALCVKNFIDSIYSGVSTIPVHYLDKVKTYDYCFFGYGRLERRNMNNGYWIPGTLLPCIIVRNATSGEKNVSYKGYYEEAWFFKIIYNDEMMTTGTPEPFRVLDGCDMTRFLKNAKLSWRDCGIEYGVAGFKLGDSTTGADFTEAFSNLQVICPRMYSQTYISGFYCNVHTLPDNKLRNFCDDTMKNYFIPRYDWTSSDSDYTKVTINGGVIGALNIQSEFVNKARQLGYMT